MSGVTIFFFALYKNSMSTHNELLKIKKPNTEAAATGFCIIIRYCYQYYFML